MELVTVVKIVKHIYDNGFYVLFKQKPLPVYFEELENIETGKMYLFDRDKNELVMAE